jgi:hypothetical protein
VADQSSAAQDTIASEAYLGSRSPVVILDGLFGLGAKPPLRHHPRSLPLH